MIRNMGRDCLFDATRFGATYPDTDMIRGAFNNASAGRATGRASPERERSPVRYRALATQAR